MFTFCFQFLFTIQTSRQDESKGAIPKRPRNSQEPTKEVEVESDTTKEDLESKQEQWRRKALRRRPPTPPTTSSHTDVTSSDLRQRILEILSTTSNEECDRQLSR